ncbi:MAG: cytochrome P450 [Planctomycetaceae bacterium]|nr:cytochrome P450 [Planctomycetaceae bacterium]
MMADFQSIPLRPAAPVSHESLLQFPEDPVECMRQLHRRHGDIAVMEQESQRLAFVFSPELNRQVLTDSNSFHSRFFAVRGSRKSAQRRVTSGLLSQNGAEHRDTRRILKDVFSKKVLPGYHPTICRLTEDLLKDWHPGSERDLNVEMVQFMLRMTSALLFGLDDAGFAHELGHMIDRWVHQNHEVGMGALVSGPQFNSKYDELLEMADELENSIQTLFHKHRNQQHEMPNVLSLLFHAQASSQQLSDEKLTGHATLLFAAAHLTTAHTFSWTLFLLAQHPEIMQRVSGEVAEHVHGERPTIEELDRLEFLEHVIKESMRVLPASAYSQRIVAEPVTLNGIRLSPGTPVVFSQYITHHRPDLFESPDEFQPDRWKTISPSPYEYLPFGAGPRMCIGAPLAMAEIKTALALILKRCRLQMTANATVNGQVISTMLGPTSPIRAKVIPAGEETHTVPVHGSIHDLVRLPIEAMPQQQRRAA